MNVKEQLTEKEIIDRVIKGEKSLYELIVRRFNPYLYKIGRSYNYEHEDTQDLMQESFIDAYKNLQKFEGKSSFKTWIARIMLNNCYHKKMKLSSQKASPIEITEKNIPMFANHTQETGKKISNNELKIIIEKALQTLQENYRMVFSLREISGFNVVETAELLEISESNVKTRLSRAKEMLRNEIEKSYSANDLYEFNLVYCDAIVKNVMLAIQKL